MIERTKQRTREPGHQVTSFSTKFWDGVEREIESLDVLDFELFLGADGLAIEPRPGFADALAGRLQALCRTRWSN